MARKSSAKKNLGRGLSTLLSDLNLDAKDPLSKDPPPADHRAPIELLHPNPKQPRRNFTPEAIKDLADSIRQHGIIQPLVVRPEKDGKGFMIVAGERRWRAAQMAELREVPVIVRDMTDRESLEIALIENIQRAELNALEEAEAYRQLMDAFGRTQEQLSLVLGRSRSHVANMMRLLSLPDDVKDMVRDGQMTTGHARALASAAKPSLLARQVLNLGLSVRQTEELVKRAQSGSGIDGLRKPKVKDADTRVLEASLSAALKAKVSINVGRKGVSGRLVVGFTDLDHLNDLCGVLKRAGQGDARE